MKKTIEGLNLYLSNINVLYRKVQNYHWNLVGKGFFKVHEKLEEIYTSLDEDIDTVAERILAIGGRPYGSMKKYLESTSIEETEDADVEVEIALTSVVKDLETLISQLNELKEITDNEKDYGTSSELDTFIVKYEKTLWMLRSYLKNI